MFRFFSGEARKRGGRPFGLWVLLANCLSMEGEEGVRRDAPG